MKYLWKRFHYKAVVFSVAALCCVALIVGMFIGCGKLSDDTSQPTSPLGTTGGISVPWGPQARVGTYTMTIVADPSTIPADTTNYSTLKVTLQDAAGRSVGGFPVVFTTGANIGWLWDPEATRLVNTFTELTDASGKATIRFYGSQSGQAVVTATTDIDNDSNADLQVATTLTLTPSGPPDSAGSYTLRISSSRSSIPADMGTYAVISAKLTDSAGGSVENFTISFESELGYLSNEPVPPTIGTTTATALTNPDGGASVYFYADRAGSAVIRASVSIPDLIGPLQDRLVINVTEGPGVPGTGVIGLMLEVLPAQQILQADGDTGVAAVEPVTLTAHVWDNTGDHSLQNVRVEFYDSNNNIIGYAHTNASGIATLTLDDLGTRMPGTYTYTVKACATIDGVQYCDTGTYTIIVADAEEQALTVTPSAIPEEIEVGERTKVLAVVTLDGVPLSGATVTFRTGGLLSPTTATVTTDSSGVAQYTFTGLKPGDETVYISASKVLDTGVTASGTAEQAITVIGKAGSIEVSVPSPRIEQGEEDPAITPLDVEINATAVVRDASGNFVEGIVVSFSVTPGAGCEHVTFAPPSSSSTTEADGLAKYDFTVTGTAYTTCSYTVRAEASGRQGTDSGLVTFEPKPEPTPTPVPTAVPTATPTP